MASVTLPPAARGCFMTRGLYLKANGELPCWDDVGESKVLRRLDPVALKAGREVELSNFGALRHIRKAFAEGKLPHPGLCETCAVRSAGVPFGEEDEAILQVLHVEPSYMCHLSCPQCVPQKLRKSIKSPPYHLAPEMYDGFLRQLRSEGIREIKLVIFEGRGDPLASPDMEKLFDITRQYYPGASTCITTHGSYPYKPWIARSSLDVIRFSVDGARQENYAKYRIGGKLDTIFNFMESLQRDRPAQSSLYVEWKYILFEWNDSDEELAEAASLATKLGVQLRFCRTHSPGRSLKYDTGRDVAEMIRRVAPGALQDLTFQLKDDLDIANVEVVRDDQIRSLFRTATECAAAGDEAGAGAAALKALAIDGGIARLPQTADFGGLETLALKGAGAVRLAVVTRHFADLLSTIGRRGAVGSLLERYVALSPHTADRRHVEIEAAVEKALSAHGHGDADEAERCFRTILAPQMPAGPLLMLLGPALAAAHPGLSVASVANVLAAQGHPHAAILLFDQYLTLAPHAADWAQVSRHVMGLRQEGLIGSAYLHGRAGQPDLAAAFLRQVAVAESVGGEDRLPSLEDLVGTASPAVLEHVSAIAREAGNYKAAYLAERRLRHRDG